MQIISRSEPGRQLQSNQQTIEETLRAGGDHLHSSLVTHCSNVSGFERPDLLMTGTIEYYQHYMQIVWRMS